MRHIAIRDTKDPTIINAWAVRNNHKVRPNEAIIPDDYHGCFAALRMVGDCCPILPNTEIYEVMDQIVPDISGDLAVIRASAELLANQIESAITETSSRLKGRGISHPHVLALVKYQVLKRLDKPRKIRAALLA